MKLYIPQPAHKIYAFDRGWRILRRSTLKFFEYAQKADQWCQHIKSNWKSPRSDSNRFKRWGAYTLTVACIIAGKAQYLSTILVVIPLAIFWCFAMILWVVGSLIIMFALTAYTKVFMLHFRIFNRCQSCHRKMSLPVFRCDKCAIAHTRLIPSIYGLFHHSCMGNLSGTSTCTAKLSTLDGLGREKLTQYCMHCNSPMHPAIGRGTNVHIALVGGPGSGKTNYMFMAIKAFKEKFEQSLDYRIVFMDQKDKENFKQNEIRLSQGRVLLKTPDVPIPAYNLEIKAPDALVPKLAYVYDVAGETFYSEDKLQLQRHFLYNQGIIFVIDPCAIPEYRCKHEQEISRQRKVLWPSPLKVTDVYDRMMSMFNTVARGRIHSIPVAIVINKVDALGLENEIGTKAISSLSSPVSGSLNTGDAINLLVREFLYDHGLGNFVRDLEAHFSYVRYFSCSALGRLPDANDTSSFTPIRVLEPLEWLLTCTRTVRSRQKYLPAQRLVQKIR
jgi:hypothetical protein